MADGRVVEVRPAASGVVRILVVDDRVASRNALLAMLAYESGVSIVGGGSLEETGARARELHPDVILVGVDARRGTGVLSTLAEATAGRRTIVVATGADGAFAAAALQAGVSGVLEESVHVGQLLEAVAAVSGGNSHVSPCLLCEQRNHHHGGKSLPLSQREREVLRLLADGHATKQVAGKLGLSPKTIETHRLRIMRKLKLYSIAELTKFAIRQGITGV